MTELRESATAPVGAGRPRPRGAGTAVLLGAALLTVVLGLRLIDAQSVGWLNNILLIGSGLLLEAVPFLLLGAAVAAAIEVYVPQSWFLRFGRVPRGVQMAAASFGGFLFPVCECGSVPVARRLLVNGLTPGAALTFMLAAPVVNPVVILSTWFAFRGQPQEVFIVVGRIVLGIVVALVVGALLAKRFERLAFGRGAGERIGGESRTAAPDGESVSGGRDRLGRYFEHLGSEFFSMLKFMLIGATIAAVIQTFVPQNAMNTVSSTALIAIPAMMLFAYLLSLCSESDAILISSFTQFSPVAQLAFLVFGPMLDLKLTALYTGAFGRRMARVLVIAITGTVLILCLWIEAVWGLMR